MTGCEFDRRAYWIGSVPIRLRLREASAALVLLDDERAWWDVLLAWR